ncbi:hypothetical protein ACSBR1_017572 [Camellia fascicularis]
MIGGERKNLPSLSQLSFFSPSASPPLHRHQPSCFFVTLLFINPSPLRFQFIARKTFCSFFIAISCGMKLKCLDVLEFFFPDIFLYQTEIYDCRAGTELILTKKLTPIKNFPPSNTLKIVGML